MQYRAVRQLTFSRGDPRGEHDVLECGDVVSYVSDAEVRAESEVEHDALIKARRRAAHDERIVCVMWRGKYRQVRVGSDVVAVLADHGGASEPGTYPTGTNDGRTVQRRRR